mmetsp:Transcript_100150/g.238796  ORF Transcript_100150/g.238796 Transcript_100150/m.238796 type:complete len:219 (+) Transcript_100150:1494-2150(+)
MPRKPAWRLSTRRCRSCSQPRRMLARRLRRRRGGPRMRARNGRLFWRRCRRRRASGRLPWSWSLSKPWCSSGRRSLRRQRRSLRSKGASPAISWSRCRPASRTCPLSWRNCTPCGQLTPSWRAAWIARWSGTPNPPATATTGRRSSTSSISRKATARCGASSRRRGRGSLSWRSPSLGRWSPRSQGACRSHQGCAASLGCRRRSAQTSKTRSAWTEAP